MRTTIILAALLFFATSTQAETLTGPACVHDGDTIRVGAHRHGDHCIGGVPVRLQGIAAPELADHARSAQEALAGLAARRHMIAMAEGRTVSCALTDARSWGRYVGVCRVDGVDLARALIAAGLALDCARYSGGAYAGVERRELLRVYARPGYCW